MRSRRRNAPSVPAALQRSASGRNRRFSLPENLRRLAIATTSGSRRASSEAVSPVALRAPSAMASEEEPNNPFVEDFSNEVMRISYLYSKLPETGVSPHIGTGGAHTHTFPDKTVSFVSLNSAFGCGLEGSDLDRGRLVLPAENVLSAFQAVPEGHLIFSLMHHTMADLNEAAHRLLIPMIEGSAELYFYGHVHTPRPTTYKSPGTSCFMLQGGALYEKTQVYNGYSLID